MNILQLSLFTKDIANEILNKFQITTAHPIAYIMENIDDIREYVEDEITEAKREAWDALSYSEQIEQADDTGNLNYYKSDCGEMADINDLEDGYNLSDLLEMASNSGFFSSCDSFYYVDGSCLYSTDDISDLIDVEEAIAELEDYDKDFIEVGSYTLTFDDVINYLDLLEAIQKDCEQAKAEEEQEEKATAEANQEQPQEEAKETTDNANEVD